MVRLSRERSGGNDTCDPAQGGERMTVMSDPKIKIIEGIYEAFGRGDVDAILAVVTALS